MADRPGYMSIPRRIMSLPRQEGIRNLNICSLGFQMIKVRTMDSSLDINSTDLAKSQKYSEIETRV